MREWGKGMGCEAANVKMISDGNTELSKVERLQPRHAASHAHDMTWHQPNACTAQNCHSCSQRTEASEEE